MNLTFLSLVLVFLATSLAENPTDTSETVANLDAKIWEAWKTKYGKTYSTPEEESYRFDVWVKKLNKVTKIDNCFSQSMIMSRCWG